MERTPKVHRAFQQREWKREREYGGMERDFSRENSRVSKVRREFSGE